jgi:hypothetical protein
VGVIFTLTDGLPEVVIANDFDLAGCQILEEVIQVRCKLSG